MKKIAYTATGAAWEPNADGKLVSKAIRTRVELPYSAENLIRADSEAEPGSVTVFEVPNEAAPAQDRLILQDRATGKAFEIFIQNGKLMMEVI